MSSHNREEMIWQWFKLHNANFHNGISYIKNHNLYIEAGLFYENNNLPTDLLISLASV